MNSRTKLPRQKHLVTHKKEASFNQWIRVLPTINGQLLRAVVFITTLILAGVAIIMKVDSTVVWTFLGMVIARTGLQVAFEESQQYIFKMNFFHSVSIVQKKRKTAKTSKNRTYKIE